ncbi:glycosyltransferase [Roseomonas hellenica]|uniref:Glycosyltransferase n=1 Tax=Plastoroseomonas hellenica TaxID=2687306 RepID=A0ABS5EWJ2_9PROT|nr:TIGR04282 family arsenosugar biosynthesis glycosyltransferase [Plastoroseomonas hellenica]MBR0664662.1 glycosyltransferase [Plastoroseomonas hellenica]
MRDEASVAVAIICKTPAPGFSKTRLSPPLRPEECAQISACFIHDLAATIDRLAARGIAGVALYTPPGSEPGLKSLLPGGFWLLQQGEGDLGARLHLGMVDLLAEGHVGAIIVNSDSPTLPSAILEIAAAALRGGASMVISPAVDGGYTLIGLLRPQPRLFADMPWSTSAVFALTLERAREIGLTPVVLPTWYDVDDASSYALLEAELDGQRPEFADATAPAQDAPWTRAFVARRRAEPAVA